jgi:geranylgeranylglycerol-phosphate geranylgeranyltransferase
VNASGPSNARWGTSPVCSGITPASHNKARLGVIPPQAKSTRRSRKSSRLAGQIAAILELIRWKNGLLAAASVLATSVVAAGRISFGAPVLAGAAAVFAVLGAGNALNDRCDAGIDRTNAPGRPVPSGRIAPATALVVSIVLFIAGNAVAALLLPVRSLPYLALNSALLVLYGFFSKRAVFLPNLAVAWMSASVFLFAGAIIGSREPDILVLAAGAFLTTMSREIFKDIEDMGGDSLAAARTLPLVLGPARAGRIARLALVPALGLLVVPPAMRWTHAAYVVFAVPAFAALVSGLFVSAPGAQRRLKLAMGLVLAAFVAGSF